MHQQHNMSCMAAVQGHGVAPSGSTCGTALSVQGVTWVGLIYAKIYLIIFFNLKMPVFEGKMCLVSVLKGKRVVYTPSCMSDF